VAVETINKETNGSSDVVLLQYDLFLVWRVWRIYFGMKDLVWRV